MLCRRGSRWEIISTMHHTTYLGVRDNCLRPVRTCHYLSSLLENIEIELLSPVLELPDLLDEAGVLEGGLEADNVLLVVSRGHQLASSRRHLVIVRFTRVVYSPFLLQKLFKSV